ncbi:DoxX family membrane protein [Nakamurella flavida]|uniref:DoxX family membrane protein n=1 Tax=Nakamurella flavida TaxID=363630 RepID=A0A938YM26_9ACTN|nr:MauE/DoxX family redox-associated membrane protein [Nakamurella flavida]MBM9477198.1 DoxX family membrane protein [Nakamurella flavida]MDP9780147.1 putative membrane protein YphA (DoxX/SURF4 family) [Nakamurella flavida]
MTGTPGRARLWDTVGLLARFGLAAVWLSAGIPKALDARETTVAVRAYQVLPEGLVPVVAGVLPFLEIALALLLIAGLATRLAAVLSAVLLVIFIAGVAQAAIRGLTIDCGCFGGGGDVAPGQTAYTWEIVRDLGFLALAGFLVARPRTAFSVDGWTARRAGGPA